LPIARHQNGAFRKNPSFLNRYFRIRTDVERQFTDPRLATVKFSMAYELLSPV
jgi:hypothetical protein